MCVLGGGGGGLFVFLYGAYCGLFWWDCALRVYMSGSGDGELRGSRLEAWMKSHKSEVAITFICTPTNQETVSVLEKTQANKTFRT